MVTFSLLLLFHIVHHLLRMTTEIDDDKKATANEGYVDMDTVDVDVRLTAGRLRAVYLSRFVGEVLLFVDQFAAAKAAVIEASSAAAQAARHNVQRVYVQVRTSTRHKVALFFVSFMP